MDEEKEERWEKGGNTGMRWKEGRGGEEEMREREEEERIVNEERKRR